MNNKVRKIIREILIEISYQKNIININDIILDKEIVLVDTNDVNLIISSVKDGKVPLDKLRVLTMADKLSKNETLPPVILDINNKLVDGFHRYAAYKISNKSEVPFVTRN